MIYCIIASYIMLIVLFIQKLVVHVLFCEKISIYLLNDIHCNWFDYISDAVQFGAVHAEFSFLFELSSGYYE